MYTHIPRFSGFQKGPNSRRFLLAEEPIAFTAGVNPVTVNHLHNGDIIKFETTITDVGAGYNNQTGIFVVPITGIYLISSSLMDHDGSDVSSTGKVMVRGEIVHNQKVVGRILGRGEPEHRDQGANTVFVVANEGDQIFIRVVDNNDVGLGGELYSTFSGFLMYPM